MLIIPVALTVFYLVGAWAAYPGQIRPGGRLTVFLVCGFLAVVFSLALSPQLLATALVLIVAGIVCRGLRVHASRFTWVALAGTLCVYAGFALGPLPSHLERQRLREQFPLESLSPQLEYERRAIALERERMKLREQFPIESLSDRLSYQARPDPGPSDSSPPVVLDTTQTAASPSAAPLFEKKLSELEQQLEWASMRKWQDRTEALRQIHASYVQRFTDSPGFGVSRMAPMTEPEKYVPIEEPKTVPLMAGEFLDWDATPPGDATNRPQVDGDEPRSPAPTADQLRTMYERGLADFVNRRGWGYVQDRDHVAGFQSHHFSKTPELSNADPRVVTSGFNFTDERELGFSVHPQPRESDTRAWQVRRLELVSLLRHDEPCVYVSDSLPRMDKVTEYETRPLRAFEQQALQSLQAGEDVVTELSTNRVHMLGAMRAAKQCLKCHQVQRGELLGAFSYVLDRTMPIREPRKSAEPAF